MDQALALKQQLVNTLQDLVATVVAGAPKVIAGIILIIVALLAAKLAEKILRIIFRRLHVETLLEKIGIKAALARIGLVQPAHEFVPRVVYFLLLFLFAQTAADALGLEPISQAIGSFFAYLPNLVSALALILIGSVGGQFAGGAVTRAARESGIDFAPALGSIVSALVLAISAIMAFAQLKIDTDIVRIVTACLLAGIALAFGLSFGLGSRDVTRSIIAGFYARKIFRLGDELEVRGERATLCAITPIQAVLEKNGQTITIPNSTFMDEIVKQ